MAAAAGLQAAGVWEALHHRLLDWLGLGQAAWRSLAWLLANRRLTVRYQRRGDLLTAFLHLACALICAHKLPRW